MIFDVIRFTSGQPVVPFTGSFKNLVYKILVKNFGRCSESLVLPYQRHPVEIELTFSYSQTIIRKLLLSFNFRGYFWSRWPFLVGACVCARSTQFYIWFETKNVNFYVSTGMLDTHKTLSVFPIRCARSDWWKKRQKIRKFEESLKLSTHHRILYDSRGSFITILSETKFSMAGTGSG